MPSKKHKGQEFERQVATTLSLWVSEGARTDVFTRSPGSGGRATTAAKYGRNLSAHAGDVIASRPQGNWLTERVLIECKFYQSFDWARDIYEPDTARAKKKTERPLEIALHTAIEAAQFGKPTFLTILKSNRRPTVILTDRRGVRLLSGNDAYEVQPARPFRGHRIYLLKMDAVIPAIPFTEIYDLAPRFRRKPAKPRQVPDSKPLDLDE